MKITQLIITLILIIMGNSVVAQDSIFKNDKDVAVNGYDLVVYQTENAAVRGAASYSVTLDGAIYYFKNEDNKKQFVANSKQYLPAYGGFCAFGMAKHGAKVPTNPNTFKIRDGKLYLFFNDFYEGNHVNTVIFWNQDEIELLSKANENWKNLK